jgi:Fe-S-cluster containining protein
VSDDHAHAAEPGQSTGPNEPWYAGGLRFTCTQCGNCCTGGPGAVWFTADEGVKIAERLGVSFETFLERWTRRIGARRSFLERRSEHGFDCIFLTRSPDRPGATCSIYDLRPTQCRTWPFWPELLESPEAWAEAKRRTPCPGMGEGRLHGFTEIRIVVERDRSGRPLDGSGA